MTNTLRDNIRDNQLLQLCTIIHESEHGVKEITMIEAAQYIKKALDSLDADYEYCELVEPMFTEINIGLYNTGDIISVSFYSDKYTIYRDGAEDETHIYTHRLLSTLKNTVIRSVALG